MTAAGERGVTLAVSGPAEFILSEGSMSATERRRAAPALAVQPPRVTLRCAGCGATFERHRLSCEHGCDALLSTVYAERRFVPGRQDGIGKFHGWLAGSRPPRTPIGPAIFPSRGYGKTLGLTRLRIAFNGYAPGLGALNVTGTFKDLEAGPTVEYFAEQGQAAMVLASAGNTARAFAYACSQADFPCCIVLPERMLERLWLPRPPAPCVLVVAIEGSNDYAAAIALAGYLSASLQIPSEGGFRNVARRDGLGTTMLEYARLFACLPRHYVQAAGSGAGVLAAHEAAWRLIGDGRFGGRLPQLHVVQNAPFTPIHDAWSAAGNDAAPRPRATAGAMYADVLSHANPPFAIPGGLRSALLESGGATYAVDRAAAMAAKARFERTEALTISEPAACACAGLERAVASGAIGASEPVLLNITGGGEETIRDHFSIHRIDQVIRVPDGPLPATVERVAAALPWCRSALGA